MQVGASELSPSLPLSATKREQRELSGKLIVKPLKDIIDGTAFTQLHEGKAELQVTDKIFAPFFNPDTSGREYYQDGDTLVVKESIQGSKIYTLAVFEKSEVEGQGIKNPRKVTFKHGDVDGKIEYLRIKNFCLVKENEEATDMAAPWYSQSESSGLIRRIGLLKYNPSLSKNQAGAIVRENSILLTDTQNDATYEMQDALGIKDTPSLSKWLGTILAGVKSTQKETDISKIEYLIAKSRELDPTKLTTEEGLRAQAELFEELKKVPNELLSVIMPRALTGRLSLAEKILYAPILASKNADKIGFHELIRLERNAAASTLYFVRQLRQMGFDLFPGITNTQLIQAVEGTLKTYDDLYSKAAKYGLQFASVGDVASFFDQMKERYEEMSSQDNFDLESFTTKLLNEYKIMMRRNAQVPPVIRKE